MNERPQLILVGVVLVVAAVGLAFFMLREEPAPAPPPDRTRAPVVALRPPNEAAFVNHPSEDDEIAQAQRRRVSAVMPSDGGFRDGGAPAELAWSTKQQLAAQAEIAAFLEKNAADAAKSVDAFCEENKRLGAKSLFHPPAGTRDAVDFMVPRMDWEGNLHPPGLLHPADDLKARMSSYGTDWPTKVSDADLAGTDLSWMKRLMSFDRWSMPMDQMTPNPCNFFEDEIPNYVSYQLWAKLRLAQGTKSGDVAEASAEVRHLADLLHSQGTLIADMVALSILRIEQRSHDQLAASGGDVTAWPAPAVDEQTAAELREVSFSGPRYFYPGVAPEVAAKAAACMTTSPCPALFEGLGAQSVLGSYASADNREPIEAAAAKAGCDARLMERTKHYSGPTLDKALELANNARPFNFTFAAPPAPPAPPKP